MFAKVTNQMGYAKPRTQAGGGYLHFVSGNDVLLNLPTGSGKSLCYSLLPVVFNEECQLQSLSFVIRVSPLAVLIRERELW